MPTLYQNTAKNYYPFGMLMDGRSYSSSDYRFGFGGMEKNTEINSNGNNLDFGARIYDGRIGRWMSVDPLKEQFPDISPFHFVENNPINAFDPNGESGVATVKRGFFGIGRRVVVESNITFYGFTNSKVSNERAKQVAKEITNNMNAPNGRITLENGKSYKVKFKVTAKHVSQKEGDEQRLKNGNNPRNNYIRVVSDNEIVGSSNQWSGNTGKLSFSDFSKNDNSNRTTPTHEYIHGLGWFDPSQISLIDGIRDAPGPHDFIGNLVDPTNCIATPGIMTPRATPANQMINTIVPTMIEPDGTIYESQRVVTQRDIDFIFTPTVISQLSKNKRAIIGTATNQRQRPVMPSN